jgi:hypothetical protein
MGRKNLFNHQVLTMLCRTRYALQQQFVMVQVVGWGNKCQDAGIFWSSSASSCAEGDMETASNALPPEIKGNVKYSKIPLANAMLPIPRCQYAKVHETVDWSCLKY